MKERENTASNQDTHLEAPRMSKEIGQSPTLHPNARPYSAALGSLGYLVFVYSALSLETTIYREAPALPFYLL